MNRAVLSPTRAVTETAWRFDPGRCILRPPMNAPSDGAGGTRADGWGAWPAGTGTAGPRGGFGPGTAAPHPGVAWHAEHARRSDALRGAAGRFRHSEPRPQGIRSLR